MSQKHSKDSVKKQHHERENKEAEELARELENPLGAQKLGDEAYELVKKELNKKGMKP